MAEYISREEAINAIKNLESSMPAKDNYAKGYDAALGRVLIAVREVSPAADVQPVRHGRWVVDEHGYLRCDLCGEVCLRNDIGIYVKSWYCPECGADMRKI